MSQFTLKQSHPPNLYDTKSKLNTCSSEEKYSNQNITLENVPEFSCEECESARVSLFPELKKVRRKTSYITQSKRYSI